MSSDRISSAESRVPDVFLDDLEQLLVDELDRAEGDWAVVEATLCDQYPESAGSIRRRVAILRDAGFLEDPIPAPPRSRTPSLTPGQVLSSYKIVELASSWSSSGSKSSFPFALDEPLASPSGSGS